MKNIAFFLVALFGLFSFFSLQAQEIEKVSEFDKLSVAGPFKVKLIKSDEYKFTMERNGYSKNDVEIEERAGELSFKVRNKAFIERDFDYDDFIEVEIFYIEIEEIKVSMGASLKSDDVIKSSYLTLEVAMGGNINVSAEVKEIDINVTMGGIAKITGNANRGYFTTNMGGEILARELMVKEANAKVNMGGVIMISVSDEISASANLGGVISYYGDPDYVDTSITLGGEIRRRSIKN
ncbi:MAG: DUF2807 domain-containing protein [Cyclobacteriaceae bacterium]|nr:DUF2807 domain-containing protein [Cyclobacteriaceae bacterium]